MEKIVVISKEDFDLFKAELLEEIKAIFDANVKKAKWIRSSDVREMLNISDGTLQSLRVKGIIPAYKLDTTWFYKYEEIVQAMERNRVS